MMHLIDMTNNHDVWIELTKKVLLKMPVQLFNLQTWSRNVVVRAHKKLRTLRHHQSIIELHFGQRKTKTVSFQHKIALNCKRRSLTMALAKLFFFVVVLVWFFVFTAFNICYRHVCYYIVDLRMDRTVWRNRCSKSLDEIAQETCQQWKQHHDLCKCIATLEALFQQLNAEVEQKKS